MYQKDVLREYIKKSELRLFSDKIKVRLSKDLALKYDQGHYQNYLKNIQKCFDMINTLNIQYPGNAKPILYVYIVPDENYAKLLKIPNYYNTGNSGGKPVTCYDLDGFNAAYGISQNMAEDKVFETFNISKLENELHELSHIIHSEFFSTNPTICEGFAETLPLYALDLEEKFESHRNAITGLNEKQIYSVQELLNSEKDGTFGKNSIFPNYSCSFNLSYISSYLFVRSCVEEFLKKYNLSKEKSIQYFLEFIKQSTYRDEWLIFDIANALNFPQKELLNGKQMQLKLLKSLNKKTKLL